jgi:signal transduction histidine kinase
VTGADESRFGVVIVVRDITREIEADRAKRDFIATVSHELRTPLTPIRGFVDLMLLGAVGQLTEPHREMLGTVKNNTMRMVSLVEDLLEIGRLEAGKIALNTAPSNINQLVKEIVSMWNLELENKRMTLDLQLDDTLPLIEYDTKRIGQVLTNLVSNAIKYTYPGGDVTIKTYRNSEGLIQVDVRDTGIGLKPEQQDNLFKRFYRADSPLRDEVGGTGLGLSIAKSFVELHHGEMWVQSVYNEGSTFSITLPEQQPRPDLGEREDMGSVLGAVQPIEETTTP